MTEEKRTALCGNYLPASAEEVFLVPATGSAGCPAKNLIELEGASMLRLSLMQQNNLQSSLKIKGRQF